MLGLCVDYSVHLAHSFIISTGKCLAHFFSILIGFITGSFLRLLAHWFFTVKSKHMAHRFKSLKADSCITSQISTSDPIEAISNYIGKNNRKNAANIAYIEIWENFTVPFFFRKKTVIRAKQVFLTLIAKNIRCSFTIFHVQGARMREYAAPWWDWGRPSSMEESQPPSPSFSCPSHLHTYSSLSSRFINRGGRNSPYT